MLPRGSCIICPICAKDTFPGLDLHYPVQILHNISYSTTAAQDLLINDLKIDHDL